MKWTEQTRVDPHDTDFEEAAKPASLLRYMQTAANIHFRAADPAHKHLRENKRAFVLSRIAIDFHAPVYAYESVLSRTWTSESHGFSFIRSYDIIKDESTIATATSVWALIDIETHMPLRATELPGNFENESPAIPRMPIRFSLAKEMPLLGMHRVSYSETDINRHMNNTRYLDMLTDEIDMQRERVTGVSIVFLNEAPMGDLLTLTGEGKNGEYYFRTLRSDGKVNIEAYIRTEARA